MEKIVTLSDGEPCQVRVLGLFELDKLNPPEMKPFTYTFTMMDGSEVEDVYNPFNLEVEPPIPDVAREDCQPNSVGWFMWLERETYEAAISHWEQNWLDLERYAKESKRYIYENCLQDADKSRVVTPEDFKLIEDAALVPQVTEELIAETLRNTFPGEIRSERDI